MGSDGMVTDCRLRNDGIMFCLEVFLGLCHPLNRLESL